MIKVHHSVLFHKVQNFIKPSKNFGMLFMPHIMDSFGRLSQNVTSGISRNGGLRISKAQSSINAVKNWQKLSQSTFLGFGKLKLAATRETLNQEFQEFQ